MFKSYISVDPDDKIISATPQGLVILSGHIWAHGDDMGTQCLLFTSRATYHAMMDKWLDGKAEYFAHGGEFAGVGSANFTDETKLPGEYWLLDGHGGEEPIGVEAYAAETFEVDMEHG